MKLRAEVSDKFQLEKALEISDFEFIYAPEALLNEKTPRKGKIIAVPPVFVGGDAERLQKRMTELKEIGFSRMLVHTADHIVIAQNARLELFGGMRLNIVNSLSAGFFADSGLKDIILSSEINLPKIKAFKKPVPTGIVAYGKIPLMLLKRCPVSDGLPCGGKSSCEKEILDRKGQKIKILCREKEVELLNPDTLDLSDKLEDFSALDFFVLKFTLEKEIAATAERFKSGAPPVGKFTRGSYYRGVL